MNPPPTQHPVLPGRGTAQAAPPSSLSRTGRLARRIAAGIVHPGPAPPHNGRGDSGVGRERGWKGGCPDLSGQPFMAAALSAWQGDAAGRRLPGGLRMVAPFALLLLLLPSLPGAEPL